MNGIHKMKTFYRQCKLRKEDGTITVAYIPDKYCKVGKGISIKDKESDVWSDRWEILSMSEKTDTPPDYRKLIRSHRQATGDSMKKRINT